MMHALTVQQPWAWAIAHAGKDFENRTWRPAAKHMSTTIAIHAGQTIDEEAIEHWANLGHPELRITKKEQLERGAIVAVAVIAGIFDYDHPPKRSRWFTGPIGWFIPNATALAEPVPCKGALGLWVLPDEVEERVRAQLGRAA